jgi:hypothetical protein
MARILRNRARSHDNFFTTPLGRCAVSRDAAILTPGGRHVQRLTGLPASLANLHAEVNGLGRSR